MCSIRRNFAISVTDFLRSLIAPHVQKELSKLPLPPGASIPLASAFNDLP